MQHSKRWLVQCRANSAPAASSYLEGAQLVWWHTLLLFVVIRMYCVLAELRRCKLQACKAQQAGRAQVCSEVEPTAAILAAC